MTFGNVGGRKTHALPPMMMLSLIILGISAIGQCIVVLDNSRRKLSPKASRALRVIASLTEAFRRGL